MTFASTLGLAPAALLSLTIGCGARSALQGSSSSSASSTSSSGATSSSSSGACSGTTGTVTPAPCVTWQSAGALVTVSEPEPEQGKTLTSVVPSAGGALLAWFALNEGPSVPYRTRAIGLDGTPRSAIQTHLDFPTTGGVYTDVMSLAGSGCAFAGLADDPQNGCRFVPLDENGGETGPAVTVAGAGTGCADLGTAPGGYAFVAMGSNGGGPLHLATVNAAGSVEGSTLIPPAELAYGGRLVLDDASFLLGTFQETDGGESSAAVQHVSAAGQALADPVQISDTTSSLVLMAQTRTGVLAAWMDFDPAKASGLSIFTRSLTVDGAPTGPSAPLGPPGKDRIYGFTLASTPTGDAVFAWYELDSANDFHLYVMTTGPDGAPTGQPTALGLFDQIEAVRVLVAGDGQRALVVMGADDEALGQGILAQPLSCAP